MRLSIAIESRTNLIVCSFTLFVFLFQTHPARAGNFEVLDQECRKVKPAAEKIERCKRLVGSNRLNEEFKDIPHFDIAFAYYELNDIDHAIEHAKLYAEGRKKYYRNYGTSIRCKNTSGVVFEVCTKSPSAQVSYAYEWVARYEINKSLTLLIAKDDESSIRIARSAIASLTSAVAYDRDNHSAYAERGGLLAKFCKEDEARADYSIAIATALRRGQEREAKEYREKLGLTASACRVEFKGRN